MQENTQRYVALCAIAKDETPFIREWVAYHYLIGFERIFIYDNESATPVRNVIPDFYDAGIVDTYWMPGQGMQLTAYDHCLKIHGHEFEWMAFFDLDEFLVLKKEKDVRALLSSYEDYGGVVFNMCTFSSAGHLKRPEGLVINAYRERLNRDINIKSIIRPSMVEMAFTPHNFTFKSGQYAVCTDKLPALGGRAPVCCDEAQLNHYSFRSQQDYEEKIQRGDAVFTEKNPRSLDKFIVQALQKGQTDSLILRHVPAVEKMLGSGIFQQYLTLNTTGLQTESLENILLGLGSAMSGKNPELARLIVLLSYNRFKSQDKFISLAHKIFLVNKDMENAKKSALDLVALVPNLPSYQQYLYVLLACGDFAEARRIASFMDNEGRLLGDTKAREKVKALMDEYGASY